MTFKQAKRKLKKIADGKAHCLSYYLTEYANGGLKAECGLYTDGGAFHKAPTWDAAFALFENSQPDPKEAP